MATRATTAVAEGVAVGERRVYKLHRAFLDSIRLWGRLHELTMLMQYKVTSRDLVTLVRALWAFTDSPMRQQKWVRIAPHVIDTALLVLGVTMAVPMKRQMINIEQLRFPSGIAAAETLRVEGFTGRVVLIGDEGNAFAAAGPVDSELLAITAVHPLREEALRRLLAKAGASWQVVEALLGLSSPDSQTLRLSDFQTLRLQNDILTTAPSMALHRTLPLSSGTMLFIRHEEILWLQRSVPSARDAA